MVPDDMTSEVHAFDAVEGGTFRISLTYDAPDRLGETAAPSDTQRGRFVRVVQDAEVVQAVRVREAARLEATQEAVPPDVDLADNELGWTMSLRKAAALVA